MNNVFRTILQPESSPFQINHQNRVLCMGSCFAEHIFERLNDLKFNTILNPFGIIFNPISIAKSLEIILDEYRIFEKKDLFQHFGGWHSFQHHSSFSNLKEEVVSVFLPSNWPFPEFQNPGIPEFRIPDSGILEF